MMFDQTFSHFSHLNTLPHTSVGLTSCISIVFISLKHFDRYDHNAACCVPLILMSVRSMSHVHPHVTASKLLVESHRRQLVLGMGNTNLALSPIPTRRFTTMPTVLLMNRPLV